MKKKFIIGYLVAGFLGLYFGLDQGLLAFPFDTIAQVLAHLSQRGALGNGLAMVLYVAFCLSPLYSYYFKRRKENLLGLALLVSGALFYFIYKLINPLGSKSMALEILPYQVVSILWSLIILYGVLLLINGIGEEENADLFLSLIILTLGLVTCFFIGSSLRSLIGFSNYGQVLSALSSLFPLSLALPSLYIFYRLHKEISQDLYSGESFYWAEKLAKWSRISLVLMASSQVLFNVFNYYYWDQLGDSKVHIDFAFDSLLIACLAFILSKKLQMISQVKKENDLFI